MSASSTHTLINALELFFPSFKKHFPESRAEADGLQAATPIIHKDPLCRGPCCLFAARAAELGSPRKGIALIIQQGAGLRPGELLSVLPDHVSWQGTLHGPAAILRLGANVGTKARREQVAFIYKNEDPHAYELLLRLVDCTPNNQPLFNFSYSVYHLFIRECCLHFGTHANFTGHSPRAGFASERIARGEAPVDVQRRGRWKVPSSFEIYVDVVLASQINVSCQLNGLQDAINYTHTYLLEYFPVASLAIPKHAAKEKARCHARPFGGSQGASGKRIDSLENDTENGQVPCRVNRFEQPDLFGPPIAHAQPPRHIGTERRDDSRGRRGAGPESGGAAEAGAKAKIKPPKR